MQTKPRSPTDERQAQAMKIMSEAKKQLAQMGLEVLLLARSPNGARWPVLMLEAGETHRDIEAARKGL